MRNKRQNSRPASLTRLVWGSVIKSTERGCRWFWGWEASISNGFSERGHWQRLPTRAWRWRPSLRRQISVWPCATLHLPPGYMSEPSLPENNKQAKVRKPRINNDKGPIRESGSETREKGLRVAHNSFLRCRDRAADSISSFLWALVNCKSNKFQLAVCFKAFYLRRSPLSTTKSNGVAKSSEICRGEGMKRA